MIGKNKLELLVLLNVVNLLIEDGAVTEEYVKEVFVDILDSLCEIVEVIPEYEADYEGKEYVFSRIRELNDEIKKEGV